MEAGAPLSKGWTPKNLYYSRYIMHDFHLKFPNMHVRRTRLAIVGVVDRTSLAPQTSNRRAFSLAGICYASLSSLHHQTLGGGRTGGDGDYPGDGWQPGGRFHGGEHGGGEEYGKSRGYDAYMAAPPVHHGRLAYRPPSCHGEVYYHRCRRCLYCACGRIGYTTELKSIAGSRISEWQKAEHTLPK